MRAGRAWADSVPSGVCKVGRNQRQDMGWWPVSWRSPREEQQPLRAARRADAAAFPQSRNPSPAAQANVPQAESRRLGEKEAPCFHLQRNTWRLEGDLGKDRAKKELEKQEQLVTVIAPWEPEMASGWFVLGAGRRAGAVQKHVQHHSDHIPFPSKTVGARTRQPGPLCPAARLTLQGERGEGVT